MAVKEFTRLFFSMINDLKEESWTKEDSARYEGTIQQRHKEDSNKSSKTEKHSKLHEKLSEKFHQ